MARSQIGSIVKGFLDMDRRIFSEEQERMLEAAYGYRYTTSSKSKRSGPDKNPRLLEIGTTSSERTFRLSIVPLALLAFVGVGLLLHYNDERRSIPKASQQGSIRNMQNAISKPSIGGPFELINYEGKVVTDREFVGYWTLIYFGYTSSPDVGPEEVRKMARAIDILGLLIFQIFLLHHYFFLFLDKEEVHLCINFKLFF